MPSPYESSQYEHDRMRSTATMDEWWVVVVARERLSGAIMRGGPSVEREEEEKIDSVLPF